MSHYHFVTGKLAEPAVRTIVTGLSKQFGWDYSVSVMPITVAALMTAPWLLKRLVVPAEATELILPGYLQPELDTIGQAVAIPVRCGPKNIRDLPKLFGQATVRSSDYGQHSIEILAEINHANQLSLAQLQVCAQQLQQAGADIIDLGCTPNQPWKEIGQAVQLLRQNGIRVSVDSFDPDEVSAACAAGAELVLSVNSQNCQRAKQWNAEVVAIPDTPADLASLDRTIQLLEQDHVRYRIDPILEPIGLGFAASLQRYLDCRRKYPTAPMLMGIGNITELTDADSAGINTLLLGFCQELGINSVLTTQVINWARTSVKECDLARRLVFHAVKHQSPPKHLESKLVMLRDPAPTELDPEIIAELANTIRDHNFRIFTSAGEIHAVSQGLHASGNDPFEVMQQIMESHLAAKVDSSHAFYLGFEMCKALQALILSKNYEQDEALQWGLLTKAERHWRLKPSQKRSGDLP
jgi:dihydropteroate synthase-like protein